MEKVIRTHAGEIEKIERKADTNWGRLCWAAREHFEILGYKMLAAKETDRVLPTEKQPDVDLAGKRLVFLLKPPPDGDAILPVVTLKCEFSRKKAPMIRVLAALYFHGRDAEQERALNILGLRFDAPEGDGDGRHDFYHQQFINGFEKDIPFTNKKIETLWFPDGQPSVPVDASCAVSLFVAFLVSVYGLRYLDEIVKLVPSVAGIIRTMSCCEVKQKLINR